MTCGKVERFQQTMKQWLRAQAAQPTTIAELQTLLDAFVEISNQQRPHRSLPHRGSVTRFSGHGWCVDHAAPSAAV